MVWMAYQQVKRKIVLLNMPLLTRVFQWIQIFLSNYRSISIVCVFSNVIEKVINRSILEYLGKYKLICDRQQSNKFSHMNLNQNCRPLFFYYLFMKFLGLLKSTIRIINNTVLSAKHLFLEHRHVKKTYAYSTDTICVIFYLWITIFYRIYLRGKM